MAGAEHTVIVRRYTSEDAETWNRFVEICRNGTFLHDRRYMDYHADRFDDHSLMFMCEDELIAIMPAHIKDGIFCSHNGLTYGGLLLPDSTTTETVLLIFEALRRYLLEETDAKSIIYRPVPYIYHRYPCEEELYALFRNKAKLVECKASSAIKLKAPLPIRGRRKLTAAVTGRMRITEEENYAPFWKILGSRLKSKYGVSPVHSLEEIERLHALFPERIRLFTVRDENGDILGGTLLYVTGCCVHMQYSGTTEEGRRTSALDYLYGYLIGELFCDKEYFDFGVSVEEGGHYLNCGLIAYKERLGGRTVTYNTYLIDLKTTEE